MSNALTIAAGIYRLTRDVKNPDADRRFAGDWAKRSKFPAGLELLVEVAEIDVGGDRFSSTTIRSVEDRFGRVRQTDAAFAPLVAAVEPIPESPAALIRRLDVESMQIGSFCRWLVESGKMTAGDFERVFNEWCYGEVEP